MSDTHERGPGVDGKAIAKRAAFFVGIAIIAGVGLAALPGVDEVRDKLTAANPWWIVAVAVLRLNSMMGFVREHVAQHFDANRPGLGPSVPDKRLDTPSAAD